MPGKGLEPSRSCEHTLLKRACIPFHHPGLCIIKSRLIPISQTSGDPRFNLAPQLFSKRVSTLLYNKLLYYNKLMKLIVGLGNPGEKYSHNRHNIGFMVLDNYCHSGTSPKDEVIESQRSYRSLRSLQDDKFLGFKLDTKNEVLMAQVERDGEKVLLVKPQTFMNDSGRPVKKIVDFYKIPLENILVIHDDLDLVLSSNKLQKGKGPYGHNGVLSIEESLGSKDFYRLRIGIDNRTSETRTHGLQYTLEDFELGEVEKIGDTSLLVDTWIKS